MLPRGRIAWVEFDPAAGHEQQGRRPAVIISPPEYNQLSSLCVVCPITSSPAPWPWKVRLTDTVEIEGWVIIDQLRAADTNARHFKDSGFALGPADQMAVDGLLKELLLP